MVNLVEPVKHDRFKQAPSFTWGVFGIDRASPHGMIFQAAMSADDKPTHSGDLEAGRASGGGVFATTRWSVILAANENSDAGRAALETLCQTYWFPVYALVRRQGFDPESARDFTQEFFARMLSRDGLTRARRERGRFRSYLAQSVKNFLADQWDKSQARKRGAGQAVLSLDAEMAEGRYIEIPDHVAPDILFDRQWAGQLLGAAQERLRAEFSKAGKAALLDVLNNVGNPDAPPLPTEAERLGMPLNTLKSHLRRARLRQAAIIRELVADTVATPVEVESELRHLLQAISELR